MATDTPSRDELERAVVATLTRLGIDHRTAQRLLRFGEYGAVGATGAAWNMVVFLTVLDVGAFYLVAATAAFLVAVTWNYALNWLVTFDRPAGSHLRQYVTFVSVALGGFVIYSAALVVTFDVLALPPALANALAILPAAVWNFTGAEQLAFGVRGGALSRARTALLDAVNGVAHWLFGPRVRHILDTLRLYRPLYGGYQRLLAALYPAAERTVDVGSASATFHMTHRSEVLSVHHTLAKERPILEAFVDAVEPGDVVWDVGSNLGVYACLAGDVAEGGADAEASTPGAVVAFEPHPPTAARLRDNIARNLGGNATVFEVALGTTRGTASLAVERDEVGTQTPRLHAGDAATDITVTRIVGDHLVKRGDAPPPNVLKVDVEGAEWAVLRGLLDTLLDERCRVVLVEVHHQSQSQAQAQVSDDARIQDLLGDVGFDVDVVAERSQTYLLARKPPLTVPGRERA